MNNNMALELFACADTMYKQGAYDKALEALLELDTLYPDNKSLLYAQALCLEGLKRREEAVALCDRMISEHHYDKAMILKARLVTTPSDPPAGAFDADAEAPPVQVKNIGTGDGMMPPSQIGKATDNQATLQGAAGFITFILAALPVCMSFLAQAHTAAPGALPALYPGRALLLLISAIILATIPVLYCATQKAGMTSGSRRRSILCALLSAVVALIPVLGWLGVFLYVYKGLGFSLRRTASILFLIIALQTTAVLIAAFALDLLSVEAVYMEIKAGYG